MEFFSRYQHSEQALVLSHIEMVVNGLTARKGDTEHQRIVWHRQLLDPLVNAWNCCPLYERRFPFILHRCTFSEGALLVEIDWW